jgi:hypothetical protein
MSEGLIPSRTADAVRTGPALPYTTPATGERYQLSVAPYTSYKGVNGVWVEDVSGAAPAWTALAPASGWANVGGSFPTLAYMKYNGIVYLKGTITGAGTTMFVMPAGTYPDALFHRMIVFGQFADGTQGPVFVQLAGASMLFMAGTGNQVSFENVHWPMP